MKIKELVKKKVNLSQLLKTGNAHKLAKRFNTFLRLMFLNLILILPL
jgi:hypothetical protein